MTRNSKMRAAILRCLEGTKEHPSAEFVYRQLKPLYPRLGLATVYRNLNQLRQEGAIASLGTVLGQERFDACTAPHAHAICVRCGRTVDAESVTVPEELCARIAEATGFAAQGAFLHLYGLCPECRAEKPPEPVSDPSAVEK